MAEEELQEIADRDFQAYGRPLDTVTSFKYMGRVLAMAVDDCPEVVGNLRKARKSWEQADMILGREGDNPRVSGMFFKAVVHAVLLFGSETWVLDPHIGLSLGSTQHRFARRITGGQLKRWEEGGWEYLLLEAVTEEAGFE